MKTCTQCDGKGYYAAANGPEDIEMAYCICETGKSREYFDNDFFGWMKEQREKVANGMKA